ncbi:MAG: hypothetical protein D3924_16170 [Candidatus Electrothrix sp. AR4]|nr:hypothetical protein [Candidatus Electrothrix sp. AR4]
MLIKLALLILSFCLMTIFRPLVLKIHSKMFKVSKDYVTMAMHVFLSLYKFFTFFFLIIPWIALESSRRSIGYAKKMKSEQPAPCDTALHHPAPSLRPDTEPSLDILQIILTFSCKKTEHQPLVL